MRELPHDKTIHTNKEDKYDRNCEKFQAKRLIPKIKERV